jgi:hypothetical protein
MVKAAILALVLIAAACGNSSVGQAPNPSASQTTSTSPAITWPPISADDSDSFGIDISGTGSAVSKVDIHSRYGSVSVGGKHVSALVYWQIPFSGYILYQALAVEAHEWMVFWFYCHGPSLTYIYWESTGHSVLSKEPMNGSCKSTSTTHARVSWPAVSMAAPTPVHGFTAHGALLEIDSAAPGSVQFGGRTWALYPYATVDCSKVCGSPGWYELHSLLWDSTTGEAAYAIVYFTTGQSDKVQIEYGLEFPSLGRLSIEEFTATWTHAA